MLLDAKTNKASIKSGGFIGMMICKYELFLLFFIEYLFECFD